MLVVQSCLLFVTPRTVACQSPLSMEFSRQEYGLCCHFLLQGMFLTQGSNLGLLHCRQTLYWLSHPRNPLTKTLPGLSGRGTKGNHNLIRSFTSFLFVTQSEVFTKYYQWFSKQIKPRLDFGSPKDSCHNYSEHVCCCSCGWSSIFI